MTKTTKEVYELKRSWRADPTWDIEETEGFEEHTTELLLFRLETEKNWALERALKAEGVLSRIASGLTPYLTFILDGRYERRPS